MTNRRVGVFFDREKWRRVSRLRELGSRDSRLGGKFDRRGLGGFFGVFGDLGFGGFGKFGVSVGLSAVVSGTDGFLDGGFGDRGDALVGGLGLLVSGVEGAFGRGRREVFGFFLFFILLDFGGLFDDRGKDGDRGLFFDLFSIFVVF